MTNATISANSDSGAQTGEPPPESLDKVRDILFGGQMRAVDSRLQGIEARLLQAQESLRAEFTRQIDGLDGVLQKEVSRLSEQLGSERKARIEELKALASELKTVLREHEQVQRSLETAMNKGDAELREVILQQGQAIGADLTRLTRRLGVLFSDLSARLAGEVTPEAGPEAG